MLSSVRVRAGRRAGWLAILVLAVPCAAAGQDPGDHAGTAAAGGRSIHVQGFMDLNYLQSDDGAATDGFSLGQFAMHLSSDLGNKVSFFAETSFTAQQTGFTVEVERAILRYDYNDHFKISVGRYHTPINYWNVAYHHGLWLQTTVSRPEMIRVGGTFEPVHFVGLLAEGLISSPTLGLAYNAGVGNGRSGWDGSTRVRPASGGSNSEAASITTWCRSRTRRGIRNSRPPPTSLSPGSPPRSSPNSPTSGITIRTP
jgi:hypothetical protein